MKKVIIVALLIFTTLIYINAQEKQNDATWEETVEFLKTNINKLSITQNDDHNSSRISYKIVDEILFKNYNLSYGDGEMNVNLKNLKSVEYNYDKYAKGIKLSFTNMSVTRTIKWKTGNKTESLQMDGFTIQSCKYINYAEKIGCTSVAWSEKDEMVQRIYKALKHLAYLANEKRNNSKF